MSLVFLFMYGVIFGFECVRTKYINNHKGQDLIVYGLPDNGYFFYEHIEDYLYNFKEFYNISNDVKLVTYTEWKKMK